MPVSQSLWFMIEAQKKLGAKDRMKYPPVSLIPGARRVFCFFCIQSDFCVQSGF